MIMQNRSSVLLHNIRSMHNVGSIFRTADGAGVGKIYLSGYTPCPPRKEIHKTALGAENSVQWEYHKNPLALIKKLKKEGVDILALEKNESSQNILEQQIKKPFCLILGNEIEGVSDELLNQSEKTLHIPMLGEKISLNVSVAFGVAIYQLRGGECGT